MGSKSSRRYDSVSLLGSLRSFVLRLPIGIEAMSSVCIKCTKGTEHEDLCPKTMMMKVHLGMEAMGSEL
jgi:hypothetical protein